MNHYPHHIGDYVRDTLGLSMLEDGAYRRLLDHYYASERPLPLSDAELYRIARTSNNSERRAVQYVLGRFFVKNEDGYRQKRCDEEIHAYSERRESARQSASVRWSERNAKAMRTHKTNGANAMRSHCDGNANQNQNQEKERASTPRRKPSALPLPDGFAVSDRVAKWAEERGIKRLAEHLECFVSKARAKGYTYADWDEAFMGAIREDWAGFNGEDRPRPKREPRLAL